MCFPYVFPYGILNRLHAFVECLCPRRTFSGHGFGYMAVNIHGKGGSGMAKICLDVLDIIAGLQRIDGKAVSQMYHNYIDALIGTGQKDKALEVLDAYWGGMADQGADTFWELYNPQNPNESPYGGTIVNSYCHAWSCAPAYFLRKYFAN